MFDDIKDLTGHTKEQIGKITEKYIGLTKIKPSEIRDGEQSCLNISNKAKKSSDK